MRRYAEFEFRGKLGDFLNNMGKFKGKVKSNLDEFIKVGDDGEIVESDANSTGNLRCHICECCFLECCFILLIYISVCYSL